MKMSDCPVRLGARVWLSVVIASIALAASLTQVVGIAQTNKPVFPDLIQLPAPFGSEGIAVGTGYTFYVGSTTPPNLGQILVGDLRTGTFSELVPPTGREAVGMKVDARTNFLFVAGGTSGGGTPRRQSAPPWPRATGRRRSRSSTVTPTRCFGAATSRR